MKKIMLGAMAGAAAALGMAVASVSPAAENPAFKSRKVKAKRRGASRATYEGYGKSRSRYIPAGLHRNCGWNGISPKKVMK